MRLLPAALLCLAALLVSPAVEAKPKPAAKAAKGKKAPAVKLKNQPGADETEAASAPMPSRGPARIDFDDRLIQGQTNKSGSVYLYDRKELRTNSMLKTPESFRAETLESVYGG